MATARRPTNRAANRATTRATPARKSATKRAPKKQAAKRVGKGLGNATVWSIGAVVFAAGAALTGFLARRQIAAWAELPESGHTADDLKMAEHPGPDHRAPEHFRPDPTAAVPPEDREALRPATVPAPTPAADR